MCNAVKRNYRMLVVYFVFCFSFIMCQSGNVYGLVINATDIKEIAVYGWESYYGKDLTPDQLMFNVTNPVVIEEMLLSIEFSTERDCSKLGAITDAHLYIKFTDNSIEAYDLFGSWSHLSKVGMRGSCYYISEQGQTLFQTNAQ